MSIEVDLNRISRGDYAAWLSGRESAEDRGLWDAEHLIAKVVQSWPFERPISLDGYLSLGLLDAQEVDDAVNAAVEMMLKKRLER